MKQSLSTCEQNDPDSNYATTPTKDVSIAQYVEDVDCEAFGATLFLGTKPLKKVNIKPNYWIEFWEKRNDYFSILLEQGC